MAASPVKFLFWFLLVSILLWLLFIFASRLLAWFLSRVVGASVGFRVGGWKCLRDVIVKFEKGSIESISVGEIRVSLRQSLVKLGAGFLSRDPKLQVLICDLEVVMRTSSKSAPKKARPEKTRKSGKGKWMVVANMARFLSISVTDLSVKTPKITLEVKELTVDISKDGGSKPTLFFKLHLLPIIVHMGDPRVSVDLQSNYGNDASQSSFITNERPFDPFSCEELSLSCECGHDSEVGVIVKNAEITTGEIVVNLNEELFQRSKSSPKAFSFIDNHTGSSVSAAAKRPHDKQHPLAALTKYTSMFPEKVFFNIPSLDVRFSHQEHNFTVENKIMGIQLKGVKSRSSEDVGDSTRLDFQMDFSEIHLLRDAGTSVLEILKVDVVSSVYVPLQQTLAIRAEIDVKLGGTHCNIIINRLKPWLRLHFSKKKKMILQEESSTLERSHSTKPKFIMWTCTVSAPEMTVVIYSIDGSPLYHGCSQSSHVFANNISTSGNAVHMELGELNLHMSDEYQECLKEGIFGLESNSGSLMHVAKVSLDWGKKDLESSQDGSTSKLVLSVDVTGMTILLTLKNVESLVSTTISFQALLIHLSAGKKTTQNQGVRSSKPSGRGTRLLKFNLEKCSVNFFGETGIENTVVADPKRVNYGSQGGRVIVSVLADGTTRSAKIMSSSDKLKKLKYSVSLA